MRINKKLTGAADFNPTKKSFQMTIEKLCEQIEEKEIVLPLYQTGIRWTIEKSIDLFNFQLLGKAPVAPLSLNQIKNTDIAVEQVSFIDRKSIIDDVKNRYSVTDGQQRLSCNYKAYIDHPEFRNIVLDLVKGKFLLVSEEIKRYQIPVGKLLNRNVANFFDYVNSSSYLKKGEVTQVLLQIRNKLQNYSYTINLAEDLTEDEQVEWFEKLNNAGTRVSHVQMKFAKLLVQGIDIYAQYTDVFKTKLEEVGMDVFRQKTTEVSYPIAALNPAYEIVTKRNHKPNCSPLCPISSDTNEDKLCSLNASDLNKCFDLTLDALDKTIDFINNNDIAAPERIEYITYVLGVFVYNGNQELSNIQKNKLINWYKNVQFTNKSNTKKRNMFEEILKIATI
ncbi:DUF262 domain-containing protein [Orenia marismortui]|uniref:DUF262 domain-containing protein n=1 Tax=Orenia marismortui TaxID=46469 RepID=A0A4R8GYG8_9FIRM|nr:DUF262 domain-containing protein [Orenia marismortui]TDX51521.1 hypothetical protein C7959_11221 [Orenia marismortui]